MNYRQKDQMKKNVIVLQVNPWKHNKAKGDRMNSNFSVNFVNWK